MEALKNIILNHKICNECKEIKTIDCFEKQRGKCKVCTRNRKLNYYNNNKEKFKKYYRYVKKSEVQIVA